MPESEINPQFEKIVADQGAKSEILKLAEKGDKQLLKEKLESKLSILRNKVDLFREARKIGNIEEAGALARSFEKEIKATNESDLYRMILNGLLETRNRLIKDYWNYVKKYRGYIGFDDPEKWRTWKQSLTAAYEGHQNFENWSTLMKASILTGQIDRLKNRISQARELEYGDKKYKVEK